MNGLFFVVFLTSGIILLFISPENLFSAMLSGGEKATLLSAKLIAIYAVSMGLVKIMENSGLMKKLSKLLKPINKKLFLSDDETTNNYISTNLSANILGLGGIATPMGIKSIEALSKRPKSYYTTSMFFVINATSLQLLPISVIAMRTSYGSVFPSDILLPCIICTLFSTIIGCMLVNIFIKRKD